MKTSNDGKYRDEYIALGIKIGYVRRMKGLTQEQLAEKAGISMGFLSQIEAPNMATPLSLNSLFAIAKALDVPASKLLENDT